MLHPLRPQTWCASGEPPWMLSPATSGPSASSSPGLAPILSAADSCQRHGPLPPTSAPWWPAPPEDQPPIRVVGNVDRSPNSVL
jgi:hypothetical protein